MQLPHDMTPTTFHFSTRTTRALRWLAAGLAGVLIASFALLSDRGRQPLEVASTEARAVYGNVPLSFELNEGQADPAVRTAYLGEVETC